MQLPWEDHSFSKYSFHKLVTDERTNRRTDGPTNGQVDNIMRPASPTRQGDGGPACDSIMALLEHCV